MQWNLWRLFGRQVDSNDVDTRALLDDFARLSISSRINGPARSARPRINRAGIITFVVVVATIFCLQQSHMRQQPLSSAPATLLGPHIGAASSCTGQVYITPGDPLQAFSATLSTAKPALPGAATPSGPVSAVQLSARQTASTVQPAPETGAAADCAKAGTETAATASAESDCPNIDTEADTSDCPQVTGWDADPEEICLEPDQTATAAVDTNTAAMQTSETASPGTDAATIADLTIASTPEPPLSLSPGMSAADMLQAVLTHAAVAHHRNPADDIAAAAIAFKPHRTWWLQGSLSASEIADIVAITGAGSSEFEGLFKQLPFVSTSRPTAVAATAQFLEASASIIVQAFVATEQCIYSALRHSSR